MKEKMKEITLVGDYLGTTEEFLPGHGTYSEEGKIYASIIGNKVLDSSRHVAKVDGSFPENLSVGATVFGDVLNVQGSIIQVIIRKIQGSKGKMGIKAGLHVSNIADEFIENPGDKFGIGDIVKAKVIKDMSGRIDLATKGNLGVVKAFCKKCMHPLVKTDKNLLECEFCGSKETRKIASDYGNVSEI